MDRVWQWVWDRHGRHFVVWALLISTGSIFPVALTYALAVVAIERPDDWFRAIVSTVGLTALCTALSLLCIIPLTWRNLRPAELWAAGRGPDPLTVLEGTYAYARGLVPTMVVTAAPLFALLSAATAGLDGMSASRVVQFGVVGAAFGWVFHLAGTRGYVEAAMRPIRLSLTAGSGIGDHLPRHRPSLVAWSATAVLATSFIFSLLAGLLVGAAADADLPPLVYLVIATALTVFVAVPTTVGAAFVPSLSVLRELDDGAGRVIAGDFSQRLPVVQDDDLGVVVASFNRMQAGLAERRRLHAAFGMYVDPALAARLLEQGDDVFSGERREVTVMFIDIRDFTAFAEANTAEDVVARLNELFGIVVPTVVEYGGHVNKFLGDGALAVFGAPNQLDRHADAAVAAAERIERRVAECFGGEVRFGIGINTGQVIAGTIGGGGKLEFTLIGDTVNVAARVEQLTKSTGDTMLLTQSSVDALHVRPVGLADRGPRPVKGKSEPVHVYAFGPRAG